MSTWAKVIHAGLGIGIASMLGAGVAGAAFPGGNGKIAFEHEPSAGNADIFSMDPDGQNQMPLAANEDNDLDPSYSADGEKILFVRSTGDTIWVMNSDGSDPTQLTAPSPLFDDGQPSFSPDGQKIVFTRAFTGNNEIFVMDANGANPVPLTNNSVNDEDPAFSPDGQSIVFSRDVSPTQSSIFVMDATGQNPIPLTEASGQDQEPAFSPDGQQIAFAHDDSSDSEIFVMTANGENETPLTSDPANDFAPAFSPDGQKIAFTRGTMANENIFVMDANGQNQAPLTTSGADFNSRPDWQPLNPPALDLTAAAKQKSAKFVTVTVSCQNEDATVELGGTVKAPKAPKGSASAAKAKTFDLGAQTLELEPGQPVTVQLAVPKKARKLLKKGFAAGKKGTAAVTATATDDLGASSQDAQSVKLKKKPKKK